MQPTRSPEHCWWQPSHRQHCWWQAQKILSTSLPHTLMTAGKEQSVNPVAQEDALSSVLQRSRLTKCLCMGLYRTGAHNRGRIVPPWPSAPCGGWVPCSCSVQEDVASVVPIQWWRPAMPWAVSSLQSIWKAKADDLWWQQGRAATSSRGNVDIRPTVFSNWTTLSLGHPVRSCLLRGRI